MGTNYHYVMPGAPVKFSASRENAITDMLNSMNGVSSGAMLAGAGSITRLKVYNPGTETLQAGWAVVFSDGAIIDGAVAANKFDRTKSIWGVLTDTLDPMCFGEVIISGPVEVEISGGSGKFAAPASDGKTFTLGSTGAQVISHKDTKAVILLGGSPADTSYNGYFTCKLLDRNENDIKNNQVRVAVCDGETWDEEKETSYKSIAKINGVSKAFEPIILTLTSTTRQIVLRYDFSKDEVTICAVPELRDSFYTFTDYLIGEYVEVNDMYKMVQRHTSGVLILNTYANLCLVGEYIDE